MRGESVDQAELYIAYPSREDGTWIMVTGRPLRDEHGAIEGRRGRLPRHHPAQESRAAAGGPVRDDPRAGRGRLAEPGRPEDPRDDRQEPGLGPRRVLASRPAHPAAALRDALEPAERWPSPRFEALTREIDPGARGRAAGPRLGRRRARVDPGHRRRRQTFPAARPPRRTACTPRFAVPILLRGDCLGVLEFFSHEARPVDHATLDMMASLGTQIGQFIERHQMRARVVQSEKLASLGMLSAGVAHEINNPLAYIANNLAVLDRDVRFLLALLGLYEQGRPEPGGDPARAGRPGRPARRRVRPGLRQGEHGQAPARARGRGSSGWPTSCRTCAASPGSIAPRSTRPTSTRRSRTALEMVAGPAGPARDHRRGAISASCLWWPARPPSSTRSS